MLVEMSVLRTGRPTRLVATALMGAMLAWLASAAGCAGTAADLLAYDNIIAAPEQANRVGLRGDKELSAALRKHGQDRQAALDNVLPAVLRCL